MSPIFIDNNYKDLVIAVINHLDLSSDAVLTYHGDYPILVVIIPDI